MELARFDEINVNKILFICKSPSLPVGTHIKRISTNTRYDRFFYNINAGSIQEWDGGSISVGDSDVVYIPGPLSYTDDMSSEGVSIITYIDTSLPKDEGIKKWSFQGNIEMRRHFLSLSDLWNKKKSGYYTQCMCEIYTVLNMIIRMEKLSYTPSASFVSIAPALDFMKANYADVTLSIPTLAELCGLSYSHFRKLFFDVNGMSASDYLRNIRLKNAESVLSTGDYTVTEAAHMSGFSDVYYFSNFFKKCTGMSPKTYACEKHGL